MWVADMNRNPYIYMYYTSYIRGFETPEIMLPSSGTATEMPGFLGQHSSL